MYDKKLRDEDIISIEIVRFGDATRRISIEDWKAMRRHYIEDLKQGAYDDIVIDTWDGKISYRTLLDII